MKVWNVDYDHYPQAIAQPEEKEDVVKALLFAKSTGSTVSVRCGEEDSMCSRGATLKDLDTTAEFYTLAGQDTLWKICSISKISRIIHKTD